MQFLKNVYMLTLFVLGYFELRMTWWGGASKAPLPLQISVARSRNSTRPHLHVTEPQGHRDNNCFKKAWANDKRMDFVDKVWQWNVNPQEMCTRLLILFYVLNILDEFLMPND